MTTYLLKWNPESYPAESFKECFDKFERGESIKWSCGGTKKILVGDSFFLIKSGKEGKGIIGSGKILSKPYASEHYDERKAKAGNEALFVDVLFDYLLKPNGVIPIQRAELDSPDFATTAWDAQGSGKTLPDSVANALLLLWKIRVQVNELHLPDEVESSESFVEGATKQILVNAYERNPEARRKCFDRWGYNCTVCEFRFELRYGPLGKGYMHVHHLRPLASVKAAHDVDPVNDLRPVCPNCHAMLHLKSKPMSIEELRGIVQTYAPKT
jgi:5-methylcytosine-specific restriction protein A